MKKIIKKKNSKYKMAGVISIVSHQLKTPLSVIKGYLQVLNSEEIGKVNAKQKEYLSDALQNTNKMINLVKDFLDVSRIEEGKMEFNPKSTDLAAEIKAIINDLIPVANARNCSIIFKKTSISKVMVDPMKIKQVINNLISNAIKYNSRKGVIEVTLKEDKKGVIFSCRDNGIGIPENEKNKIFNKFYRSEDAVTRDTEGTGLGLFISKAIIENSGGRIRFKSKEGEGSTFEFFLPTVEK